jgi:transposase-like protein
MRERRQYNESFRQQALGKVYTRGNDTVEMVADELNMSKGTLRNWMKADKHNSSARVGKQSR